MVRLHKSLWSTRHCRTCLLPVIILSVAACSAMTLNAVNSVTPVRQFALGEVMIEQLQAGTRDDACDYAQVLPQILTQAGSRADIYPSENYYYFSFARAGSLFSGSMRQIGRETVRERLCQY